MFAPSSNSPKQEGDALPRRVKKTLTDTAVKNLREEREALEAACRERGDLDILAVTVLTSLDQRDLRDLRDLRAMGYQVDVHDLVLSRARRAQEIGCAGVIASGLEARPLREHLGEDLIIVTPDIRPAENRPADDQKRVVTVEQAIRNGADYIVAGRPIRNAPDPYQAAMRIQETLRGLSTPPNPD